MKIILIGGKSRVGKDTLADYMISYLQENDKKTAKTGISKYLKRYAIDYFGWNGKEKTKPRTLLQKLGTDVIRKEMGKETFFIDRTMEDIEILSRFFDYLVISDIRYPLEFDTIKKKYRDDVYKIMVTSNRLNNLNNKEKKHLTEVALDNYKDYDYLVTNNETKKDLKKKALEIVKELEK